MTLQQLGDLVPNFSILVRLQNAPQLMLTRLVACLEAQTIPDWELVLVCGQTQHADRQLAADLVAAHERVRQESRPDSELVQWSCNALLPSLGTWVGFMGQRDTLLPTALEEIQLAVASYPDAKVVFTDEEARSQFGHISLRSAKGAINPIRLTTQEYLRDFTVIQQAWLTALGGFDRMASDWPAHDVYLRTLETRGAGGFAYVPQRLFQRFRDHRAHPEDMRRRDHMVGFDLWAIRQHLARQQRPGTAIQRHGTAEIAYQYPRPPAVSLIVVATSEDRPALERQLALSTVKPMETRWITPGPALIDDLNRAATLSNAPLVCFLQGSPINPQWLARLVDHAQLPGAGAIGARLMTPIQVTQPGLLRYRFEGWDWNTRGRFNELAVPHQVSAVSPHCLLIDVQVFLTAGGFSTTYPTLYGMDLCLRLDAAGKSNILVPDSQVLVPAGAAIPMAEAASFDAAWAGWSCRFGLHLPE